MERIWFIKYKTDFEGCWSSAEKALEYFNDILIEEGEPPFTMESLTKAPDGFSYYEPIDFEGLWSIQSMPIDSDPSCFDG